MKKNVTRDDLITISALLGCVWEGSDPPTIEALLATIRLRFVQLHSDLNRILVAGPTKQPAPLSARACRDRLERLTKTALDCLGR